MAKSTSVLMLAEKGTSFMARVRLPIEQRVTVKQFIRDIEAPTRSNKVFLEIKLEEDLYINCNNRRMQDCKCYVPVTETYTESVNSAYTSISSHFEKSRRNPGGNAPDNVFFEDAEDGGKWKPLEFLIIKKIPPKATIAVSDIGKFLANNQDMLREIVKNNITKEDIVALAYRKNQINLFHKLISDDSFFEQRKLEWQCRGDESVWQYFFERNPWIFGYGLRYIFTSPVSDKLEKVVQGFTFFQHGKRTDALLKTRGAVSALCLVEIKTHRTLLLASTSYRADCWSASEELSGGIAQIQKTVQKAANTIKTRVDLLTPDGDPTGETLYMYKPKSILVVGSLDEFKTPHGANEEKFGSFELLRQNINNPEIITFDELYERAKFIVQQSE